ncbi:unnamed protein product [Effrenium voratum]|nr:unnamed protein product [Effrenium voratum]
MPEDTDSRAFTEAVQALWDAYNSDLGRLQSQNERLVAKLQEVKEETSPAKSVVFTHNVSESSSEGPQQGPAEPRSAWAVVPTPAPRKTRTEESIFFESSLEAAAPTSIWVFSRRVVSHPIFDVTVAMLIFANAVVLALETQTEGLSVGASLEYQSLTTSHTDAWTTAEPIFATLGTVFGVIFTLELVMKFLGLRLEFFRQIWNWIDLAIIVLWIVSISTTAALPVDPTLLRVARLARLLRLMRVLHSIRSLDALYIITTALSGSMSILGWACVLFFFVQLALALLLTGLLTSYYFNDATIALADRQAVYVYFGTFTRHNLMKSGELAKIGKSEVNGVFMQETFSVASSDDRVMIQKRNRMQATHKKKMKRFFSMADKSQNGSIDIEEFRHMTAHSEVSAWLSSMDLDVSDAQRLFTMIDSGQRDGKLSLEELIRGVGRLKGPAKSLDVACMREEISELKRCVKLEDDTIKDRGRLNAEILMRFRAALLARALELGFPKKYSSTEVPDLVAAAMLRVLDLDRSYRLSRHEFCCAVVVQKLAPPAEAPHLFEMLCHGQSGMCGQFHHAANTAVKVDALKWLYTVAARPEDLEALAAEGKAKDEAEKGSGKGKDAKGERVQRLRRVWTETPAVFQRLREEQEKKVEAMLRQKASPEPPDSPRPVAHGAPIHLSLYEDAVRRETARREASEPPSIKPARTHDPEYIDRLAQKPATKEVEEVATSKRPVNRSRLTQLVDERRLWHEDRERQRQAKIDVEMKEWEQAAAQLREEVARKSKVAMAVKKWRQMLAQVVIVAAFAPGLKAPGAAGDDGGVWQLLALAAGSTKVHLRLADEELVSGVKDRARITMAARMKLLVRFKQVEEHWGCGLDELLQDLSPDEPRHGLDGQMKSGAPFHGPSQKAVAGPPVDLPAQFVPFEAPQPRVVPFEAPSAKAGLPCEPEPKAKAKQRSKTPPLVNERNMNGTPPRRGLAAPTQLVPRVLPQQLSAFET